MNGTKQWSIRRMFLWIFVSALVMSHVANFFKSKTEAFADFSIDDTELKQWLKELDSTVSFPSAGSTGSSNSEGADSETDYSISMESSTAVEALKHLQECIMSRANLYQWQCLESGLGGDSFHLLFSKGATKFRIYVWSLPTHSDGHLDYLETTGKNVMRLKMLQVGYRYRD